MSDAIKICLSCSEPFRLEPNKPGFANRRPACSAPKPIDLRAIHQAEHRADLPRRIKQIDGALRAKMLRKENAEREGNVAVAAVYESHIRAIAKRKQQLELELGNLGTLWEF